MGMSVSSAGHKAGRQRRGVPRYGAMAEINMTPFIDVMLVLLIIFMVAAPLLATGVPIDLPDAKAGAINTSPISVTINREGLITLNAQPVTMENLINKVESAAKGDLDTRIEIRGDKLVNYGRVIQVIALIHRNGYKKLGIITKSEEE